MLDLLNQRIIKKIQLQIMLYKNAMYLQKREQLFKQRTKAFSV
jgi:hypothetical protein